MVARTLTMQNSKESRVKPSTQRLAESMKALTPAQREEAIRIAAKLLASKAKKQT